MRFLSILPMLFGIGALAGLVQSMVVWFCGAIGINAYYRVKIEPEFDLEWLYPRIIWGGLWGFLFTIRQLQEYYVLRGMLISLIPSLAELFFFFPIFENAGIMGERLGDHTYWLVIVWNMVWGVAASLYIRLINTHG